MIKTNIHILKILLFLTIVISLSLHMDNRAYADNVKIVIDPGHGGNAEGGLMDDRVEREINLITAYAMKERLLMYDGVEVFMTRVNNEDKELSRKQRLEYAQTIDADFFYSLHYNMSENHTLFGSEVWVCSSGPFHVCGKTFAMIEMEALTSLGLFDRGIKCRLSKDGGEYYGILKYSRDFDIPAVIIEHCHLDEDRDSAFWNEDAYRHFGEIDADCVAKYFGLKSDALGVDYSDYSLPAVFDNDGTEPDTTHPEYCKASILQLSDDKATIRIESIDEDNYIQYYQYSLDNGRTWSVLLPWTDRSSDFLDFDLELSDKETKLLIKTYNKYDLDADSDVLLLPARLVEETNLPTPVCEVKTVEIDVSNQTVNSADNLSFVPNLLIFLITGTSLLLIYSIVWLINDSMKSKNKSKKD